MEAIDGMMKKFPVCQEGTLMKTWKRLNFELRKINGFIERNKCLLTYCSQLFL
jgi:hypothetical protein